MLFGCKLLIHYASLGLTDALDDHLLCSLSRNTSEFFSLNRDLYCITKLCALGDLLCCLKIYLKRRLLDLLDSHLVYIHFDALSVLVKQNIDIIRTLGIVAPERSKRFPDAPTMKEVGYDINSAVGRYIAAPKGVPAEKRKVLEDAFKTILSNPEVIARYENAGTVAAWKSGDELRKMFEDYEEEGRAMVEFYQKSQSK